MLRRHTQSTPQLLLTLGLLVGSPAEAATPFLLKDINPGGAGSNSSPTNFMDLGTGVGILQAYQGSTGQEIWRTDGTAAGTYLLHDYAAGSASSSIFRGVVLDGIAYFTLAPNATDSELYRSDGSSGGTYRVVDLNPGGGSSFPSNLTVMGSQIFFYAQNGSSGFELFRTDGTAAGTGLVKDIYPGSGHGAPQFLTVMGGLLYFQASDGSSGAELWRSDGTAAGTVLVKDIRPGSAASSPGDLRVLAGKLYFTADDGVSGRELWTSDGTTAGTVLVRDIWSGANSGIELAQNRLWVGAGKLLMRASDGTTGYELWASDGTSAGTVMLGDQAPGGASSDPQFLCDRGSIALLSATTASSGRELWRTDGTPPGTQLVKDILSGAGNGFYGWGHCGQTAAFFVANDGSTGNELWTSDGSSGGTFRVADVNPGSGNGVATSLERVDYRLLFQADSGSTGWELWAMNLDEVAPSAPTLFNSSPAAGIWTSTTALEVSWSGAADEFSGLAGYSFLFDTIPTSDPDTTVDLAHTADPHAANGTAPTDGDWYLHVRACDRAGNCGPAAHHGPLRIDVTNPAAPTDLASPSHGVGAPNDDSTIDVSWTAAADATSGTVGHAWSFSASSVWPCDDSVDGVGGSATSDPLTSGSWWFHACAVDAAGNWGPVASLGPFVLDLEGAQVLSFGSVTDTEDGVLSMGEQLADGPTQLLVRFDEAMGVAGVESSGNYLLVEAGPNEALDTLSCAGGPLEDDQAQSLAWSVYGASPPTAAVGLTGRIPAPQGTYRWFACATLEDVAGNPLNGDGLPGDGEDHGVDFSVQATNLLTNPNFDGDLGSWATGATAGAIFGYSTDDADGAPSSGAIRLDSTPAGADAAHFEQCFALPMPSRLRFAGHLAVAGGLPGTSPSIDFAVEGFDQPGCEGSSLGSTTVPLRLGPTPGEDWEPFQESLVLPAGTQSARLRVRATAWAFTPFAVAFDSLVVDDGAIFADDFETGNGARWSLRFPPF